MLQLQQPSRYPSFLVLLLLFNMLLFSQADWIDPDTPERDRTIKSLIMDEHSQAIVFRPANSTTAAINHEKAKNGKVYHLVMSDEFNIPNREFHDGADPKWTAIDKNDYTNDALHYYSPANVRTNDLGELEVTTEIQDTRVVGFDDVEFKKTAITKHFKSGMLQSWNKFCFTGGIVEAEVILPGWHDVGGLWPAFWLLGNLARHTFVGSSQHVWPFSANRCDDVTEYAQLINGCIKSTHYGLEKQFGRGAPEIDIFEVQPGSIKGNQRGFLRSWVGQPFASASYQLAPGRPTFRPGGGFWPGPGQWYTGMEYGNDTCLNILYYGVYNFFRNDITPRNDYWSDAISYNRQLNQSHFTDRHKFRLEWGVPKRHLKQGEKGDDGFDSGYLAWFLNDELIWTMNGTSVEDADLGAEISSEPMSFLINTAISVQWGFPVGSECPGKCPCKQFDCRSTNWEKTCGFNPGFCDMMEDKPKMKVNYVRVYQDVNDENQKVGCSTPERPTRRYIEANAKWYKREEDAHPLKKIQRGRGKCDQTAPSSEVTKESCGGAARGKCAAGSVCECFYGWTGPHCLVPQGSDPIPYDQADTIWDLGCEALRVVPNLLWLALVVLCLMLALVAVMKPRLDQWTPIPDDEIY